MLKADFQVKDKTKGRDKNWLREAKQQPEWDQIIAAMHDVLEYFIIHCAL